MGGMALVDRLADGLQTANDRGELEFIGGAGFTVRVTADTGVRVVRSGGVKFMWSWLNGFRRGQWIAGPDGWWTTHQQGADERLARARRSVEQYRRVLVDPSLADQLRVQVLAAAERLGWDTNRLVGEVGRSAQTVRAALAFGDPSPRQTELGLLEAMLRAMDTPVLVARPPEKGWAEVVAALSGPRIEPAGVARMRALVIAVEARLVDSVAPTSPQKARRAGDFVLTVAGDQLMRPADTLVHWLRGLADGSGDGTAMTALNLE